MTPQEMTPEEKMADLWEAMVPENPVTRKPGWLKATDDRLAGIEAQQKEFSRVAQEHARRWPNGCPIVQAPVAVSSQSEPSIPHLESEGEITKDGLRLSWRAVRWIGFTLIGLLIGWGGTRASTQSTETSIQAAVTKAVALAIEKEFKHEADLKGEKP
jgi:hypothetical protein